MNIMNLINALPGAAAQGLIWGIMAIGVYITFRVLDIADLTVDGSLCTGGAVCIMMMLGGQNVWVALLCSLLAGMAAGLVTGLFHTFMGIPAILSGILTQLGLMRPEWMIKGRSVVIVVIFIVAAIITPPDVVSQIMIALPMLLLYQLSIWLCRIFRKRKIAGNEDEDEDEEETKASKQA